MSLAQAKRAIGPKLSSKPLQRTFNVDEYNNFFKLADDNGSGLTPQDFLAYARENRFGSEGASGKILLTPVGVPKPKEPVFKWIVSWLSSFFAPIKVEVVPVHALSASSLRFLSNRSVSAGR